MKFTFIPCATIPRLAWCAHFERGGVATVYHGPWVETREDWFVEGAWNGPFEKGEMDRASFMAGTGGVLREGRAVFVTPTDTIGRLYSLRVGDSLFLSNSLVFVMAMAADEPDPLYPFYSDRLRKHRAAGISKTDKTLHTRLGRHVGLHEYCQVAVGDDLRIERLEKPVFQKPASFEEYRSMLQAVLEGVLKNAASSGRRHQRYEGLATLSGGYDSNALTALLVQLGVSQALTIARTRGDDSGEDVARHLGIAVSVYGQADFRTAAGVDEAEFLSWPDMRSDIVMAACERQLVGKVLMVGRWGDKVFSIGATRRYRDFRGSTAGGGRMIEFRLRTGFLLCNPFFAAGLHLSSMRAISTSPEMKPWRVGGSYDRPIPRRILEEAGVPRGTFGSAKRASANYLFRSTADLTAAGRADFESYRRSLPHPTSLRDAWQRGLGRLGCALYVPLRKLRSVSRPLGLAAESLIPRRYREWSDMQLVMQWGHSRVRKRYAEAVAAFGEIPAPPPPAAHR